MTNREKYAEEILDIACGGGSIAMCKISGKIAKCIGILCEDCKFYSPEGCHENIAEWANAEYVGKTVISKRDRGFLEYIKESYRYMTRDMDGGVYVHQDNPRKMINVWDSVEEMTDVRCFKVDFPMLKWEDEKPWLIEDLKKLEVVEEYE